MTRYRPTIERAGWALAVGGGASGTAAAGLARLGGAARSRRG